MSKVQLSPPIPERFFSHFKYSVSNFSLMEVSVLPKDLKDFESLQEEKPAVAKTSNEDLIKFLSEAMRSTKEVAAFLGVENGTAFSRLRRLKKSGIITRRWDGQRSWWVARKAVGLAELPPEVEETEEEEA